MIIYKFFTSINNIPSFLLYYFCNLIGNAKQNPHEYIVSEEKSYSNAGCFFDIVFFSKDFSRKTIVFLTS
jgi:hypothetical protein